MNPEEFAEQYAYKDIGEFEKIVGYKVNEVFLAGWMMARAKNKTLGITQEQTEQNDEQH